MIKIRPHHLLDILRDFGNDYVRTSHPWGASLIEVTKSVLDDPDHELELVLGVDSICLTCSMLVNDVCKATITDELAMKDYNDRLDETIFSFLKIKPEARMSTFEFSKLVGNNLEVLDLFTSPTNDPERRKKGTLKAIQEITSR